MPLTRGTGSLALSTCFEAVGRGLSLASYAFLNICAHMCFCLCAMLRDYYYLRCLDQTQVSCVKSLNTLPSVAIILPPLLSLEPGVAPDNFQVCSQNRKRDNSNTNIYSVSEIYKAPYSCWFLSSVRN